MKKMLDWLTYLLWGSEIVFLAASTPHIATYFQHFDNPTTLPEQIYSWLVGYGLALTLDGVTFVVLMSLVVAITCRRPWWLTTFLVFALLLISALSWFINWQYDIVFSSSMFASADHIQVHAWSMNTSIGNLNPLIGGAFPFLSVLYALVAKALEVDESVLTKTAMTPEQFENEKKRIEQEQQLKTLKASYRDGKGLLSLAQETVMGKSRDANELLNLSLSYLRNARDLLVSESEERALQVLSGHLKIGAKAALPLLIEARSIIDKEDNEARIRQEKADREAEIERARLEQEARIRQEKADREAEIERARLEQEAETERARLAHEATLEQARLENEATLARLQAEREEREMLAREAHEERMRQEKADREERERLSNPELEASKSQARAEQDSLLDGLQGNDTVSLETASAYLGYEVRYITRLRNEGKLKHAPRREDRITVASLRAYPVNHRRRVSSNGHIERDTDPLQLPAL